MTFKEGLLIARGQIVFILALTISTGVIVWLEALQTEDRIRSRIEGALASGRPAAIAASDPVAQRAERGLQIAEEAYAGAPEKPESRAALLTSLSALVHLGLRNPADLQGRADEVLSRLEQDGGPPSPVLASALSAAAAAFPASRERIARLPAP